MMSSHFTMVLFVIIGYATTIAVIVIAIVESHRIDRGKRSLLDHKSPKDDKQQ
jgi:hypothetical protein